MEQGNRGNKKRRCLPLLEDIKYDEITYDSRNIVAPRLAGFALRVFTWFVEGFFGRFLVKKLLRDNGFEQVLADVDIPDPPMFVPTFPTELPPVPGPTLPLDLHAPPPSRVAEAVHCLPPHAPLPRRAGTGEVEGGGKKFRRWTVQDYHQAYSTGEVTPSQVAERLISAVEASQKSKPPQNLFISFLPEDVRRQAAESTARFSRGGPLSVLDGVPIAIKDEIDCLPHPSTGGTTWLAAERPVREDAAVVARLRACGALLAGKTNMHEVGSGTTGLNAHYGTARNPYNLHHYPGGSSSGSAAVVASGLCCAALGVDGGGSIRIPASLCGIVGLKPTFGRSSLRGLIPIAHSVGMVGPMTACVEDALLLLAAMAGPHPADLTETSAPPLLLPQLRRPVSLQGIRIGKFTPWFNDCAPGVRDACSQALEGLLKDSGAQEVELALPEMLELRVGHATAILSEMRAAFGWDMEQGRRQRRFQHDVRCNMRLAKAFSARDYVQAARLRTRQTAHYLHALRGADVIVTPTTAVTAPRIRRAAARTGETDIVTTGNLMRYILAGNFVGLPAITVPVGVDSAGLPIGLQIMGRPWAEATVLRVAAALEELKSRDAQQPQVHFDLLGRSQ